MSKSGYSSYKSWKVMLSELGIFSTKDLLALDFSNSGWKNRIKILFIGIASILLVSKITTQF
jgi:hypothetical protein